MNEQLLLRFGNYIMMKLLAVLIGLVLFSSVFTSSYAISPAVIELDPLPSKVKRGDVVKITGVFKTQAGTPLAGKFVNLVSGYDNLAKTSAWTDSNGKFVLTWTVAYTYTTYKWYVSYVGDLDATYTESQMYSVLVDEGNLRQPVVVSIDPMPTTVNRGDVVKITGTLSTSDGKRISGKPVNMVNSETGQISATTMTDSNGQFTFDWTVAYSRDVYHWVTEFRGDDEYDYDKSEVRTSEVATLESPTGEKLTYKLWFLSSGYQQCTDNNILELKFYEAVTDQYLTKYGIPHQSFNSECVNVNSLTKNSADFNKEASKYDLPIIILSGWTSLDYLLTTDGLGHFQWNLNQQHIVSTSISPSIESDTGAWILSHELSHFALNHKKMPRSIVSGWVHEMQAKAEECLMKNNLSFTPCTELYTTVKSASGKTIKVMKIYDGEAGSQSGIFYDSKKQKEAMERIQKMLIINELSPKASKAFFDKRYDDAITLYEQILEHDPENSFAFYFIGQSYGYLEKFDEAKQNLAQAIELNPEYQNFRSSYETLLKIEELTLKTENKKSDQTTSTIPKTTTTPTTTQKTTTKLPDWIKNNARWWSSGAIEDRDFSKGIEYMIKEEIIRIPQVQTEKEMGTFSVGKIPDWIKNNARWWSEGKITDDDFSKGIEYMVKVGIIKV